MRDINRTFPAHDFFRETDGLGQESLLVITKVRAFCSSHDVMLFLSPRTPHLNVSLYGISTELSQPMNTSRTRVVLGKILSANLVRYGEGSNAGFTSFFFSFLHDGRLLFFLFRFLPY